MAERRRRPLRAFDPATTAGLQRIVGIVLFLALVVPLLVFNRIPKLNAIRADITIAIAAADAGGTAARGSASAGPC